MTNHNFIMECFNISLHVNGPESHAPYVSIINGDAHVVVDNLGEFRGHPVTVLAEMVAAAKARILVDNSRN